MKMRVVENGVSCGIFQKRWGREVYIDTVEDVIKYLNVKGLNFISQKVKKEMDKGLGYKEMCISESETGYVFSVARCGGSQFQFWQVYSCKEEYTDEEYERLNSELEYIALKDGI